MKFNVTLEKVWTIIKNSYKFLKNLDNFEMFITYHNVLEEVYFTYTPTQKKLLYFSFWTFELPLQQTFFYCFYQITKATTFTPAQFAQNVLGLTLVLCIVFITDFLPWLHVKWFQSTEVRQFWPGFKVIERGVGIIISHATGVVFYIW